MCVIISHERYWKLEDGDCIFYLRKAARTSQEFKAGEPNVSGGNGGESEKYNPPAFGKA